MKDTIEVKNPTGAVKKAHDAHVQAYKIKLVSDLIGKALYASNDDYSAFVSWMPHVDGVNLSIHEQGWSDGHTPDFDKTVYLGWEDSIDDLKELISKIK